MDDVYSRYGTNTRRRRRRLPSTLKGMVDGRYNTGASPGRAGAGTRRRTTSGSVGSPKLRAAATSVLAATSVSEKAKTLMRTRDRGISVLAKEFAHSILSGGDDDEGGGGIEPEFEVRQTKKSGAGARATHQPQVINSIFGHLIDQGIPEQVRESGYSRRELFALFMQFKGLCALSETAEGIDKETFRRAVPQLVVEDKLFIDRVYTALDVDGSGTIEWDEFITAMSKLEKGTKWERTEFMFDVYDVDKGGTVDKDEMAEYFLSSLRVAVPDDHYDKASEGSGGSDDGSDESVVSSRASQASTAAGGDDDGGFGNLGGEKSDDGQAMGAEVAYYFVDRVFDSIAPGEEEISREHMLQYVRDHPEITDVYGMFGRSMLTSVTIQRMLGEIKLKPTINRESKVNYSKMRDTLSRKQLAMLAQKADRRHKMEEVARQKELDAKLRRTQTNMSKLGLDTSGSGAGTKSLLASDFMTSLHKSSPLAQGGNLTGMTLGSLEAEKVYAKSIGAHAKSMAEERESRSRGSSRASSASGLKSRTMSAARLVSSNLRETTDM